MSKAETTAWNLSDITAKRRLMEHISTLKGLHDITIKPRRITRTLNQNSYYWIAVVTIFAHWLREQYGDPSITLEDAHDVLKRQILGVRSKEIGKDTIEIPASTRVLDKIEFADYIDQCAAWLADFCGLVVIDSKLFFDEKEQLRKAG